MQAAKQDRKAAYVNKTRHELQLLAAEGSRMVGNAFAQVVFAKGEPTSEELADGKAFCGADGKALKASLTALGYAPEDWCGLLTVDQDGLPLSPELLRRIVATLDPTTLVLCDEAAAQAVREAYADQLWTIEDLDEAMLVPGTLTKILGVRVLSLGNFADALDDAHQKQVMWARLKQIPPLGAPY